MNRFQEIDALRGIAALMVVFFHVTALGNNTSGIVFHSGATGVELFFIISGFVISNSIHAVSSGSEFIINRVSRLYPTYWACVTLTFFLATVYAVFNDQNIPWEVYVGNMTMFQHYLGIPNLDGPYWTMIIEMNFYIFILLLFISDLHRFVVPISLALTILIGLVFNFYWSEVSKDIFQVVPLLKFFPTFFSGVVFYQWKKDLQSWPKFFILLLVCFTTQVSLYGVIDIRFIDLISRFQYAALLLLYFTAFYLFVQNKLSWIVNRPLLFLGKVSFALYLTHQYLLVGHILPLLNRLGINFWIAAILIAIPASIMVATAITYLIEIPYSLKMKKWLQSKLLSPVTKLQS